MRGGRGRRICMCELHSLSVSFLLEKQGGGLRGFV